MLGFCTVLIVLVGSEAFAERVRRPWRDYAIVATASALAGLFLLGVSSSPAALIFWLICTAMALFWVWYWARTERPLPSGTSLCPGGRQRAVRGDAPGQTQSRVSVALHT